MLIFSLQESKDSNQARSQKSLVYTYQVEYIGFQISNFLKQKLDYLFIITESKLPKFEFWRTFSLVSEASFVY